MVSTSMRMGGWEARETAQNVIVSYERNLPARDFQRGKDCSRPSVPGPHNKQHKHTHCCNSARGMNEEWLVKGRHKTQLAHCPWRTITNRFSLLRWLHLFLKKNALRKLDMSKPSNNKSVMSQKQARCPAVRGDWRSGAAAGTGGSLLQASVIKCRLKFQPPKCTDAPAVFGNTVFTWRSFTAPAYFHYK